MPATAPSASASQSQARTTDASGHNADIISAQFSPFTVAASGTVAGTLVYPNTADPSGTAVITAPQGVSDSNGLIKVTTSGTQTTGTLAVINFQTAYAYVPTGVSVTVSAVSNGAAAGGTITTTTTAASLTIAVGTALTTSTAYYIRYTIAG